MYVRGSERNGSSVCFKIKLKGSRFELNCWVRVRLSGWNRTLAYPWEARHLGGLGFGLGHLAFWLWLGNEW